MKTIIKKISLFLVAITSMVALVGCFSDINEVTELEFVNLPQSTYYKVDPANATAVMDAYETLLGEITIKIKAKGIVETKTLKDAMDQVSISFDHNILTSVGTKTMVITLGSSKLTYVFNVVEAEIFAEGKGTEADPYIISTPQQLINIGTRVFGIPVPSSDPAIDNEASWMYYYQFSLPYLTTGKHYRIVNDLDFSGVTFRTIGSFGGMNYVPFTGVLDGQGHKIKNLTVQSFSDSNSLFAALSGATVKNLTFTNININSWGKYAGALFSQPGDAKLVNNVINVNVESGSIIAQRVGGLAGEANNTIFNNCVIGSQDNPKALKLTAYYINSGGLVGASLSGRDYSYKKTTYKGLDTGVLLGLSTVQELTGTNETEYVGAKINTTPVKVNKENSLQIVAYNCKVYAEFYCPLQKGVYTTPTSVGFFAYNSGEIMDNDDTSVVKENLTTSMAPGTYDSVKYTFAGNFANGNYGWEVVHLNNANFDEGTIDLDALEFFDYVYDINGEIIDTKEPTFKNVEYNINAIYFDINGNILGIYVHKINDTTHLRTIADRVFTYGPKE